MSGHLLAFLKIYTTTNYCKAKDSNQALKLENRLGESPRGFESLRLRQKCHLGHFFIAKKRGDSRGEPIAGAIALP